MRVVPAVDAVTESEVVDAVLDDTDNDDDDASAPALGRQDSTFTAEPRIR